MTEANNKLSALRQNHERELRQLRESYESKLLSAQQRQMGLEIHELEVPKLKSANDELRAKNEALSKELAFSNTANSRRLL